MRTQTLGRKSTALLMTLGLLPLLRFPLIQKALDPGIGSKLLACDMGHAEDYAAVVYRIGKLAAETERS